MPKKTTYEISVKATLKEAKKRADPKSWKVIPDEKVRHVWANEDGSGEITVDPGFYSDNGTPVCVDEDSEFFDCDMVYVRTEIMA